jgi:methylenetetrahydrofolate reductase (NADPH)
MNLADAYRPGHCGLSFELYPPKTEAGEAELYRHVADLVAFGPAYITCTYGAGGSTRTKTLDVVQQVNRRFNCLVASHLTCVGATVGQLREYLGEARDRGVQNIVALRGDPPQGQSTFQAVAGGLKYANELVALIRGEFPDFGIAVAGYPETHREAPSPESDLTNLRRKVDAGGQVVITQLFYRNEDFFRFVERCHEAGIRVPIIPGVLPVTNLSQIKRIATLCGARLPDDFVNALAAHDADPAGQFEVGVEFAIRQVQELLAHGVPGIHFYVLNKSQATARILRSVTLAR